MIWDPIEVILYYTTLQNKQKRSRFLMSHSEKKLKTKVLEKGFLFCKTIIHFSGGNLSEKGHNFLDLIFVKIFPQMAKVL